MKIDEGLIAWAQGLSREEHPVMRLYETAPNTGGWDRNFIPCEGLDCRTVMTTGYDAVVIGSPPERVFCSIVCRNNFFRTATMRLAECIQQGDLLLARDGILVSSREFGPCAHCKPANRLGIIAAAYVGKYGLVDGKKKLLSLQRQNLLAPRFFQLAGKEFGIPAVTMDWLETEHMSGETNLFELEDQLKTGEAPVA